MFELQSDDVMYGSQNNNKKDNLYISCLSIIIISTLSRSQDMNEQNLFSDNGL